MNLILWVEINPFEAWRKKFEAKSPYASIADKAWDDALRYLWREISRYFWDSKGFHILSFN